MGYKGQVQLKASDLKRQTITGSTSATHTLTWSPPNEQSLIITINGVKQHDASYSITAPNTLVLSAALVATDEMEVIGINDIGTTITPAQNSVTADTIEDGVITNAKINASAAIATSKISGLATSATTDTTNASNIASGTLATARLGSGTADATTFLRGDQSWASAGGDNSPAFEAQRQTDQSISDASMTKVELNVEIFDSDSAFDPSTNYRFTVPSGEGGKYFVYADITFHSSHGDGDIVQLETNVKKNGSTAINAEFKPNGSYGGQTITLPCQAILILSAADYLELNGYYDNVQGSSYTNIKAATLGAYKLIGI